MEANQSAPNWNRGLLSDFLWLTSANQMEFTEELRDVYREECVSQNNVYRWTKHGFATINFSQKDNPWCVDTDSLVKKKFQVQWSVKKNMLIVFWHILISLKNAQL